jgi:hypothetical protein
MAKKTTFDPLLDYSPTAIEIGSRVMIHTSYGIREGTVVAAAKSALFPGSDQWVKVETCGVFGKRQEWTEALNIYTIRS